MWSPFGSLRDLAAHLPYRPNLLPQGPAQLLRSPSRRLNESEKPSDATSPRTRNGVHERVITHAMYQNLPFSPCAATCAARARRQFPAHAAGAALMVVLHDGCAARWHLERRLGGDRHYALEESVGRVGGASCAYRRGCSFCRSGDLFGFGKGMQSSGL
jgi:hypothetical protein